MTYSTNSSGLGVPVPVNQGGTGETTSANALTNLGALPTAGGTMTGYLILNADPATNLGAATKQYVDNVASGIIIKTPCLCGSTGNFTATYANGASGVGATLTNSGAQAAFSTDGISPSMGDRVLVKDQSTTLQNGVYTLTTVGDGSHNWVLTRATDYDTPAQIVPGTLIVVQEGTVNAITSWLETATVTAVGTDPIVFTQFTAGVGANISLSNLTTTSINQFLLPSADVTQDLGAQNLRWTNLFAENIKSGQTATNPLNIEGYNTGGASYTNFFAITAGNPPTAVLGSSVTATTQSALDNSTKLATTAYVDAATGGGAGANAALSNLASVAINTSLLAGSDNAIDLGSAAKRWRNALVETVQTGTSAAQTTLLQAYNTNTTSYTTFATLTANNPPTMSLASAVTGTTQSALDNSTKLATTAYVDAATGGGAGANVGLTNLSGVAVNASLIAGADGTLDLGSATYRWRNAIVETLQTGTTNAQTTLLQAYNTNTTSYVTFATLTANNPPTMALASAVTGVTQSPLDNTTKLATTAYVDAAVVAGGANVHLSNLSAVAINTSLLPGSDGGESLGNASFRWANTLTETLRTGTTGAQTTLLQAYDTNAASYTTFATLTANNPPTMSLASAVTGVTQSPGDNSTKLATTAYADAIGTAGANTALSNLASVAINASLIAGADGTLDLGSAADRWRNALVETIQTGTTGAQTTLLQAYNTNTTSYTTFATLTANNPPTMSLASAVTGTTQSAGDNSTKLATTAYIDQQLPWTVSNGGTGVNTLTTAYGTLCAGTTATGTVQTVAPGTTAHPLVSAGNAALPSYALLTVPGGGTGLATATTAYAPICAGTTATGAFQAASTGLSTSGYVLTSTGASSLPTFQATGATAGGLVLIATATASSSASISFAGDLTATYNQYQITFDNVLPGTNTALLQMLVGYGSTPTYLSSGYIGNAMYANGSSVATSGTAASYFALTLGLLSAGTQGGFGNYLLVDCNDATNTKSIIGSSSFVYSTNSLQYILTAGYGVPTSNVLTSVKFSMSSGNIASGNFYLYGLHK